MFQQCFFSIFCFFRLHFVIFTLILFLLCSRSSCRYFFVRFVLSYFACSRPGLSHEMIRPQGHSVKVILMRDYGLRRSSDDTTNYSLNISQGAFRDPLLLMLKGFNVANIYLHVGNFKCPTLFLKR